MNRIEKISVRSHAKASEVYIDVIFRYRNGIIIETSVPIQYRRTGTDISKNDINAIDEYLEKVYEEIKPANWEQWREDQKIFWKGKQNSTVTKPFFDKLSENFKYVCASCQLPENPNPQRRIQDLKEFGYTIATRLNWPCPLCGKKTTQLVLLPIKRGGLMGYETWSPALRKKIIATLEYYDAYEAKEIRQENHHIDHKFSEIRWDASTMRPNLESLTEEEIIRDFQLISNQRNQQKREVCRKCFQTGKRGIIYGIPFFYEGTEQWDSSIPKTGKKAEAGCVGCAWYDIETWRRELIRRLKKTD